MTARCGGGRKSRASAPTPDVADRACSGRFSVDGRVLRCKPDDVVVEGGGFLQHEVLDRLLEALLTLRAAVDGCLNQRVPPILAEGTEPVTGGDLGQYPSMLDAVEQSAQAQHVLLL